MKKITLLASLLFVFAMGYGQTFPGTGTPTDTQGPGGGTAATCGTANELNLTVAVTGVGVLGVTNLLDQVDIDITHTWDADIDIFLIAPDGTTIVELTTDNGGSGDDYAGTQFRDNAATSITAGSAPFTGPHMPEQPLSTFNGVDADGTWTLNFCDDAGGDTGTFNSWSLTFAPVPTCTPPAGSATLGTVDCGAGTFAVDFDVTDLGDGSPAIFDGTNTFPVTGTGPFTLGGYTTGTPVTFTLQHGSDPVCDVNLGTFQDTCPPVEDVCMGAINIPVTTDMCTGITTGNNTNATDSDLDTPAPPAATCTSYGGGDIWFSVTVPASGNVTISGDTSNCCSFLWYEVYEGADCSGLTSIACSATSGNDPSAYEMALSGRTPGETLWIRAWDSLNDDGPGDFNFCAYEPSCAAPTVTIPTDPIDFTNCPATVDVTISIDDLGDSSTLTISGEDDMGNPIGTGGTATATGLFTITGVPVPQTGFSINIEHESNATCDVVLGPFVLDCPPPNDLFADAIAISCGSSTLGTTFYATQDEAGASDVATVEADTPADNDSPWVWYSFTGSGVAERITLSTCNPGSSFDTEIFVYTGTSGALTCIDDGYDECGSPDFFAETSFDSDGTTTYYIAIGGWNVGNEGDFELSVSCATLGVDDVENEAAFTYYPNPVKNTLTLNAQNNIENVTMYNMLGQEVLRAMPNALDSDLDMSYLQSGTYFVRVTIGETSKTVRVIKH
ncbi:T9SS type A sorting domain-containing protein [Winogradskyella sp. MIT101101]|uniref:T9SS type A sorting domain-containing protein n=1 Tax=Winogradskyella sp. MIT101101 TaxID=3098297 RepID=UPI00399963CA